MRLTGRKQIMAYLGRSASSNRGWQEILRAYAPVLFRLHGRTWTTAAWLDAFDTGRSTHGPTWRQDSHSRGSPP